jgi:hypothetical protein
MRRLRNLNERTAPTGEDLTHDIWREIGRWLEDKEEFELGDINEEIHGTSDEQKVLESNILFIVERELKNKVGTIPRRSVSIEIDRGSIDSDYGGDQYRSTGHFRIWHDQDSAAQGSYAATGLAGETQTLLDMTINITQASGHGKENPSLKFFG